MYDVIVMGARCAGAPAAALLARRGYRVLLADRAVFPADTLSTLYIQQPGVARLARWGVLEEVRASGCPPLDHVVYELGGVRLEGCSSGIDGIRAAYAPRRYVLDRILADAAVRAGAEFRPGTELTGLLSDGGRVTGVRLRTPDGREFAESATLVIGADGMRSAVAAHAGAHKVIEHPRMTCAYYTLWQGMTASFEMYEGPTGWVAAVPTSDAVLVAAYYPQSRFDEVRRDAQRYYLDNVRTNAAALWERVQEAEQAERLFGTGDQQNYFRQARGDGWALIGDAGHHKDSLTARGISDAFTQAELLAECIGDGLADPARLDAALDHFAAQRDELLMENYNATLMVAQADARDKRKMLLSALRTSPELTERYFDAVAGILPLKELYTPELIAAMAPRPTATVAAS
jgi:2-polyprenyl-6-methoxyphenol hydroxylase-like FAD-dependent oxidoreductase